MRTDGRGFAREGGRQDVMANQLGDLLHHLRVECGLSQHQLADRLSVTRSAIANWEAGNRMPDAATFAHIARELDVDVEVLLEAVDDVHEPPHVILVDDSPLALEGALAVLEETLPGAIVSGFSGPSEATQFCEETPVALAFIDIELGRSNGFDLCRRLVEIKPNINVAYLTAYRDYSLEAWATDACGFLIKPIEAEEVRKLIARLRHPVQGLTC